MDSKDLKAKTRKITSALRKQYPDARCMLDYKDAYQLLMATILAAQCTDKKVNEVTPALFAKYPTPEAMASADQATLEGEIKPTGFFRNKARSLRGCAAEIVAKFGGKVPGTMEQLVELPGVGRKTANVVLGECFGKPGIIVDTHFLRVTRRLGLTKSDDPGRIEQDLDALVPEAERTLFSHLITFHGRRICDARKPKCDICPVRDACDYFAELSKRA